MDGASMVIGIVGSRHFPNRALVVSFVSSLPCGTCVVSGGAQGVDTWAIEAARSLGLPTLIIQADWERHGRKAGPLRNAELVRKVDEIAAFWDGRSRGTLNTVMLALQAGLPVQIFGENGEILVTDFVVAEAARRGVVAAMKAPGTGEGDP
ncbi:cytochrome c peroxidase [Bradyrhizobium sp. USDA 4369]